MRPCRRKVRHAEDSYGESFPSLLLQTLESIFCSQFGPAKSMKDDWSHSILLNFASLEQVFPWQRCYPARALKVWQHREAPLFERWPSPAGEPWGARPASFTESTGVRSFGPGQTFCLLWSRGWHLRARPKSLAREHPHGCPLSRALCIGTPSKGVNKSPGQRYSC